MAFPAKPSSRYSSYDARSSASSLFSDQPSSSVELKSPSIAPAVTSRALARANPSDLSKGKPQKLSSMMRNLMSKAKSGGGSSNKAMRLVIPSDVIAQDLKKTAKKQGMGMGLGELPRKLFGVDKEKKKKKEVKALTDLKGNGNGNARTLAMVLRSERELLSSNKELEMEIADLKLMLEQKNKEVEKLKDLCLSQREEIKSLKNAVLFPDARNNQVQDLVDKQGSELKQAKQVIPALQRQITSLTSQLQCLADDLAEVKAEKYSTRPRFPRSPMYGHEEAANSLEFSSTEATAPGTPDDLFTKDFNPCLTPYTTKAKSKEFDILNYDSPEYDVDDDVSSNKNSQTWRGTSKNPDMTHGKKLCKSSDCCKNPDMTHGKKLCKSSDCCKNPDMISIMATKGRRSDENRCTYIRQVQHRMF